MKKLILIVLLLVGGVVSGQSVTGTSGLIHIPSARMLEDGQLVLGAAYIPKPYFFRQGVNKNPGVTSYLTYQILPFAEIMFRYTHELNVPVNNKTEYFPDRMISLRLKILKEKKNIPALVFGLHDFSKLTGLSSNASVNSMYSANYFVISKKILTELIEIDTSLGYAFDLLDNKTKDYRGVFYGVEIFKRDFNFISLVIEHNSKVTNTGFKINVISKFNLMFGFWNLEKPTFAFNYLF